MNPRLLQPLVGKNVRVRGIGVNHLYEGTLTAVENDVLILDRATFINVRNVFAIFEAKK